MVGQQSHLQGDGVEVDALDHLVELEVADEDVSCLRDEREVKG